MMKTAMTAALVAAALFGAPAYANQSDEVAVRVSRAGLDLTQPADAATMLQRIEKAAAKACADNGVRDLTSRNRARACAAKAIEQTVASLNAPLVTALYTGAAPVTRVAAAANKGA